MKHKVEVVKQTEGASRVEVYEFDNIEDAMSFYIAARKACNTTVGFNGVIYDG